MRQNVEQHAGFKAETTGYQYDRTPFENHLHVTADKIELQIELPTLDTVVADQSVPDVVEEGWQSTLRRRLGNVSHALPTDRSIEPEWKANDRVITVTYRFVPTRRDQPTEEIIAVYDFVEGTYLQGIIPGYEYNDPIAGMIAKASARGDSEESTADRGGTPL